MSRDHDAAHQRSDSRYHVTGSLYLAAFLYAHGLWLYSAETDAEGKCRFVFRDTVECERLVWQFRRAPKALVDARTYMYAIEELKDRAMRIRRVRRD